MSNSQTSKKFRIGILGGMGPMAGVYLQQLIIEATPAKSDQDHIETICFTNPKVPDRTEALTSGETATLIGELVKSVQLLESAGADVIVVACNTSHAFLGDIQKAVDVPVLNMAKIVACRMSDQARLGDCFGLLATDGTHLAGVYTKEFEGRGLSLASLEAENQDTVMSVIYAIKAGADCRNEAKRLEPVLKSLADSGAKEVILACTELSLLEGYLAEGGVRVVDPMKIVAEELVSLSRR